MEVMQVYLSKCHHLLIQSSLCWLSVSIQSMLVNWECSETTFLKILRKYFTDYWLTHLINQWHEMGYRNGGEQASSEEGVCVCTCVFVWKKGGVAKISFRREISQYLPLRKTRRVGLFGRGFRNFLFKWSDLQSWRTPWVFEHTLNFRKMKFQGNCQKLTEGQT